MVVASGIPNEHEGYICIRIPEHHLHGTVSVTLNPFVLQNSIASCKLLFGNCPYLVYTKSLNMARDFLGYCH